MARKTEFKYFTVSKGYVSGELDVTSAFLSEEGLKLLDQLLNKQASKKQNQTKVES